MFEPAPGLFSITTGWPSRSDSFWPTIRATVSVGPPGGCGTTTRMGRFGYCCACAWGNVAAARVKVAANPSRNLENVFKAMRPMFVFEEKSRTFTA
jgi:hypothetical protein